jgi:putative FmdB family regulatory protein
MPVYEYYCPTCSAKFEKLRPMTASDDGVTCSAGHTGARRLISLFARASRDGEALEMAMPSGGGCACGGGGCACGR